MEAQDELTPLFRRLAVAFLLIGALFFIVSLTLSQGAAGMLSSALGLVALFMSVPTKNRKLVVSSVLLTIGFIVVLAVNFYIDANAGVPTTPVDETIEAPEHMVVIDHQGELVNYLSSNHTLYIYFSNEDCADTRFLTVLNETMDEMGAYDTDPPDWFPESGRPFYYSDYAWVHYYDTKLMPAEEVQEVLETLGISQVPCLVKVESGVAVDNTNIADKDVLRLFFQPE